jgi:hypothetical protein
MEKETIDYIFYHYMYLLTIQEKAAWKYWSTNNKIDSDDTESPGQKEQRRQTYQNVGWITKDPEILKLLDCGIEDFKSRTAQRLLDEGSVVLNYCLKCGRLARTPKAKQCRYFGHDWH